MSDHQTVPGFHALNVPSSLCKTLSQFDIVTPTPIQAGSIPVALEGRDLIGIAQTGTGKTLAFALPMAALLGKREMGLVIAPTRELAEQIANTYKTLGVKAVLIVGGASMNNQVRELKNHPRVIVATPGRLIDHLDRRTVRLNNCSMVVLDEADRMFDMGFSKPIKRILDTTPPARQTMLFSATMPQEIEDLATQYQVNPERIQIAPQGTRTELVDQELVYLAFEEKKDALNDLLHENDGTVLVFARTKHGARKLAKSIRNDGHTANEIHANRTLAQRREALSGFKNGKYRVLVATDIAARGIDVKEIAMVVNYDVPENPEDYVHRIGRTGRAGSKGRAVTFALTAQDKVMRQIEKLMGEAIPISNRSTSVPRSRKTSAPASPKNPFRENRFKKNPTERSERSERTERPKREDRPERNDRRDNRDSRSRQDNNDRRSNWKDRDQRNDYRDDRRPDRNRDRNPDRNPDRNRDRRSDWSDRRDQNDRPRKSRFEERINDLNQDRFQDRKEDRPKGSFNKRHDNRPDRRNDNRRNDDRRNDDRRHDNRRSDDRNQDRPNGNRKSSGTGWRERSTPQSDSRPQGNKKHRGWSGKPKKRKLKR